MIFENKKAVIFDLDGTLADTLSAITEAINMTMEHYGFPHKNDDQVRKAIGNGARMLVKRLVPSDCSQNEEKVTEVAKYYDAMYAKTYIHTTEMYDGIREVVCALIEKGLKIAIYSNKQDAYVKGLSDQFFTNGEIEVARGQTDIPVKPDPTGVYMILSELGVNTDECILVGDSGVDLKTASNSGMDFIGAGWGFCGSEALLELGAENVAETPKQILKLMKI